MTSHDLDGQLQVFAEFRLNSRCRAGLTKATQPSEKLTASLSRSSLNDLRLDSDMLVQMPHAPD